MTPLVPSRPIAPPGTEVYLIAFVCHVQFDLFLRPVESRLPCETLNASPYIHTLRPFTHIRASPPTFACSVPGLLSKAKREYIQRTYGVRSWDNAE